MNSLAHALPFQDGPRLLADIGATNARFCIEGAPGNFAHIYVLPCADFADIGAAMRAFLERAGVHSVAHCAIAIANPIDGDRIKMTNHHWEFSIEAVQREMSFQRFIVVNDFAALARAIPYLAPADSVKIGGAEAVPGEPIGLVGAGTGLGVGALIQFGTQYKALASEGGHATFSPVDEQELNVLRFAWREHEHVSAERLMAGPGIELIYRALTTRHGAKPESRSTAQIVEFALRESDPLCVETVRCFCAMLGSFSGNLAVTLGARGGIYIGGGVVPKLGDFFLRSAFRERFEAKGRMRAYVTPIPVHIITAYYPAFIGVSAMLDEAMSS